MSDPEAREGARPAELVAVLGAALLARLPLLGEFPGVAADEGNWALYAHAVARGARVALPPDAAFVTPLFAWLLAPMALGTLSWTALRLVPALAVSAACVALRALGAPSLGTRGARSAALLLALHPWSVLWSRTVSVPYALALITACIGPLALLEARRRGGVVRALLAWQLVGVAVHFTPLALIPLGAASAWALRVRWRCAAAAALGWAHLAVVLPGVLSMPGGARQTVALAWASGVYGAARMMTSHLSGVSTLRHVAGASGRCELAGALLVAATVGVALWRRRDPAVRAAMVYLGLAALGLPLMLVPARAWAMPTVDADRYGFAVLAPFVLLVGALAGGASRVARVTAALAVLGCAALPSAAMFAHATRGGGADMGLSVAGGGGRYRGWQRPSGGGVLVDRAFDAVRRDASGAPAVVGYDDYALHAIRARTLTAPGLRVRHALGVARPAPGEREYRLLWRAEVIARSFAPWGMAQHLRGAWSRAVGMRRVASWRAMDGTPLCELVEVLR